MENYKPPYTITDKIMKLASEIMEKIGAVNYAINQNKSKIPELRRQSMINSIHSSLAIENNPLSVNQVTSVIDGKLTIGKPKDIQEYLGFGCVQSVYRWLDGVSMPTVDNLYAISKMLQVPMDSIVCGNAGRTKSQMDACLTDQERRVYTYYKKMRELNAA